MYKRFEYLNLKCSDEKQKHTEKEKSKLVFSGTIKTKNKHRWHEFPDERNISWQIKLLTLSFSHFHPANIKKKKQSLWWVVFNIITLKLF